MEDFGEKIRLNFDGKRVKAEGLRRAEEQAGRFDFRVFVHQGGIETCGIIGGGFFHEAERLNGGLEDFALAEA